MLRKQHQRLLIVNRGRRCVAFVLQDSFQVYQDVFVIVDNENLRQRARQATGEGTNMLVLGDTFFSQIMHTFYGSAVEDLVFEPSAGGSPDERCSRSPTRGLSSSKGPNCVRRSRK
jgi:hypothetical protein